MPLDRSYTNVEIEIIRRLERKPSLASLYDTVRKDENNPTLLHSVAEFVMHEYQCASIANIAKPYEGILTISDIRCMRQDFLERLTMSQQMAERLLLFRLVEVYERQIDEYKAETLCFKLNTCAITETDDRHFAKVKGEFEEIFNFKETEDIFTKKYLLFPNYVDLFGYITLIINPGAAIRMKKGNKSPNNSEECIMVHIGSRDKMYRYLERVGHRLDKLLDLFLGLHAKNKGYLELEKAQIKQVIRYTNTLHQNDRPFQMIHLMEKLLITDKPLKEFIEKNPRTSNQIDAIRVEMLSSMEITIREGDDEARKHLMGKTQRTGEHFRQRRIQREREEALAAEERLPKRFRLNEVITIDD